MNSMPPHREHGHPLLSGGAAHALSALGPMFHSLWGWRAIAVALGLSWGGSAYSVMHRLEAATGDEIMARWKSGTPLHRLSGLIFFLMKLAGVK